MNNRIRELAEASGAETWSRPPMREVIGLAFTDVALEKFAESIIAECVDAIMTKERHRAEYFARVVQRRFGILDDGDDDE